MSLGVVLGTGENIPDPVVVSFRSSFVFIALKFCQFLFLFYERGLWFCGLV